MWLRRKAKIAQNMWQGSTFFFKNCYSWKFEFQWRKICSHLLKKRWLKKHFKNNNIHLKISNLEGLAYLLKTGCQWRLLPEYYWARQTIYYHFRTIGDKDVFSKIKQKLLEIKRLRTKGRNLRLLRSLIVKACVQDCQNPKKALMETRKSRRIGQNQGHKAACLRRFSRKSAWNHHHKGKYSRLKSVCRTHFKNKNQSSKYINNQSR